MSIEVRSEYGSGKFLFEWDPANDTIDIVQKGMFYRVQLLRKESGGTYRKAIPMLVEAGVMLFIALVENLPTIIMEIGKAIPQIITGIVDAVRNNLGRIVEVGGDLLRGLWEGLSNAADWLWGKMKDLFTGLTNRIKEFFGIHSPSTLFAGIGDNLGKGIGVGFKNAMREVSKDMQKAIPTDFEIGNVGVYEQNVRPGLSRNTASIIQNISVSSPKALSERELAREFKNMSRKLALSY